MEADDQDYVRRRARLAAGQGALRQLRGQVDEHQRQEAARRRLLPLLGAIAAAALAVLLYFLYRLSR